MNTLSTAQAALLVLVTPLTVGTAAAQQSFGGALSLGVTGVESDDADGSSTLMSFDADYGSGPFTLDFELSHLRADADGFDDDAYLTSLDLLPKYWIAPELGVGIYYSGERIGDGDDDISFSSYGLEGSYRSAGIEASLFAGTTDSDDFIDDDIDITDVGLRFRSDLQSGVSIYGKAVNSSVGNDSGDDVDAQAYGLGAVYGVTPSLSVVGGVQFATSDDLDADVTSTAIGASYNLSAGGRPILVNGEYAYITGDAAGYGDDAHALTLGATVLLGDARSKRLPGSGVNRNLAKSDRNALSGLLSIGGF